MPDSQFVSPTPSNTDVGGLPPSVTNNTRPTIVQGLMPDHFTIRLVNTLYNTTSDPAIVSPLLYGGIFYVKNEQAVDARVVGSASGDAGVIVPAGTTMLLGTDGDGHVIPISGGGSSAFTAAGSAKAVITAALPAYTRVGGVITANAVGAPGSIFDGVTPIAGNVVLLQGGFAVAPSDAGPYVVTQMGTAGLQLILTRPSWWQNGAKIQEVLKISIQEGTLFKNTQWTTWVATDAVVVGTGDPLLFPDIVTQTRNLVVGTLSIFNVPIRSALLTKCTPTRTGSVGDVSATIQYQATVGGNNGIVAGQVGACSVTVEATVADALGTKNAADTSALNVTISNI